MKKSRIAALLLSLIMLVAACFSVTVPTSAADSDWISTGNTGGEYAYSMAVIGDTQSLSVSDAKNYDTENKKFNDGYEPRVNEVYDWLVSNKDSKNIQLVMGLGDIIETWQSRQDWPADKYSQYWDLQDLEWDLIKPQIEKLADANIPFTIVRGNHDSDKAFNEEIGAFTKYTSQLAQKGGFYIDSNGNVKYDTSYMKLELGGEKKTKWLVIQLDWAVTTAELDWAANLITTNSDHQVILTMHNYLYRDATIDGQTGSASTAVPNKNWDYSIDPTSPDLDPNLAFNPDGIWHRLVSKHENIKLVLCGHDTSNDLKVSQLIGDNGNVVTQMLVNPQAMDLDTANPGGCGMVCMLYFREDGTLVNSWDEKNIDVEWYSTIKNAFYKTANQFTIDVKYYDGGVQTDYGVIPAEYANAEDYPFAVFARDIDVNEYFFTGSYANWTTSDGGGAYPTLSKFSAKNGVEMVILLRRNFTMANDTSYSNFGNLEVTVNLDLGGYTFASDYNETAKKDMSIFQTNLKKNVKTTFNVYGKEGSALLNGSKWTGLAVLGIASSSANGAEFTYNFNGIKIGYAEGAETTRFAVQTYDGTAGSANTVTQNLNFNDCTFDLVTNRPTGKAADMFLLNEAIDTTRGNAIANVKVNGGNVIADSMSDIGICKKNDNDSFSFGKNADGEYTRFTLTSGASAPSEIYPSSTGKSLQYVSESDGVYVLKEGSLGTIDLWLIGGQSNAAGYGSDGLTDAKYDSRYTNGFDNILYYGSGDDNAIDEFVKLTVGLGNKTTSVGAEVGIAKMLGDSDKMNAVIKFARGASYLYPDTEANASKNYGTWTSPTYIKNNGIDASGTNIGALYNEFIATVSEAISLLKEMGYTPVIRGMWWMQGEAECNNAATAAAYPELLECLINDLRTDIEANTEVESTYMPFVAGNILRNQSKDADGNYIYSQPAFLNDINAAQTSVASKLSKVYTVATLGLPQIDNWHFTADAQQYLGEQFVKNVVYSEGKYSVSIDGTATEGTGFGSYSAGQTVTVSVFGRDGWLVTKVYYVVAGESPVEIPVTNGVCEYTFTMPASDVTFSVESEDTGALETEYGSIPSGYTDAQKYPFVLFKGGVFFAAYENWNAFIDAGSTIFRNVPTTEREATLLLRRNYNTTEQGASSQGLFTIEGHVNFDLGGFTITKGSYHLFQIMAKKESAKAVSTSFKVYNGNILATSSAPLAINTNTLAKADDHFHFTFNGVRFGFADGATSALLVFDTYSNGTYDTKVSVTFNDCIFDLKTNMPDKNVCIFDFEEDSGSTKSADITVNGGSILANDISKITILRVGAGDKFVFGKGSENSYTTLNLAQNVTVDGVYNSADGNYLTFGAGVSEADGTYTYTLYVADVEVTEKYGVIDNTLYPVSKYPFVLFEKQDSGEYTFRSAYEHFYDFLLDLRLNTLNVESVLYLRKDYTISTASGDAKSITKNGTSYSNIDRYFYYLKAHLLIDLNQKILTRGDLHSLQMMGNGNDVTITVKNGTLHTASGTMIPFNNTGAAAETTTLNFEGVTFTSANLQYPLVDSYTGGAEGTVTTANITFTDCVFDISNISRSSTSKAILFDLNDGKDWININVTIVGGEFVSGESGFTNINLYTVNSGKDTLTFKKDASGNYTRFAVKKGTSAPAYSFISGEDGAPELSMVADFSIFESETTDNTHNVYFLDETVTVSSYTGLPKSLTGYAFLVFNGDKTAFVGYNTWYEIWQNIWTLRKADNLVVLMLRDYDTDNCAGSSQDVFAAKNMTIDLNGHTLTRGNKHIFQLYEKGSNATYTPNITLKNGTICAKKNYGTIMYFNSSASATNISLTFTFTFDEVTFTSTDSYIGRLVAETHATNGVNGIGANIVFNGCDFVVNSGIDTLFTLNETSGKFATEITINGGSITFNKNVPIALLNSNDSLTFGKYNGSYTSVAVKNEIDAPDETYLTDEGIECVFVKASEKDGYVNYSLYPKAMVGFKIKTSVTLWSNFVYNIYIPKTNVNGFTINGKTVEYEEVEIDGVVYYHVAVNLPAGETLSDIALKVTLISGSTTVDANWNLNVLGYTKAVIAGEFDDTTKTLMKDMLVYASAAHTYFENTADVAEKLSEIATILEGYTKGMPEGSAKKPEDNTYFTDVAVYLGEVPSFRFTLASGYTADDFTFKVGNRNANVIAGDGYVEVVMYAYMMLDDVTFTVVNKTSGETVTESYNLYAYHAYVTDENNTASTPNLVNIVEALIKYSASAKAYRDSVTGSNK